MQCKLLLQTNFISLLHSLSNATTMPTGKHRNTAKRSSGGGSYASTVTTVVFVCIFILGVWMLTSNSYVSLNKSTARISQGATRSRKIPVDSPAFEDNPGDLPEDAIRPDDGPTTGANETKLENEKPDEKDRKEQKQTEMEVGKKEDKHKVEDVQISEESTMTQDQKIERAPTEENISENEDRRRKNGHQKNKSGERDIENNEEHHISEEKQQREEKGKKNNKRGMENNEEHRIREEKGNKNHKRGMENNEEYRISQEKQEEKGNKNNKRGMVNNDEHRISEEKQEEQKVNKNDKRGMEKNEEHRISKDKQEEEKRNKNDKRGMVNNEEHRISEEEEEKRNKNSKRGMENNVDEEKQEKRNKNDKRGIENNEEHEEKQEEDEKGNKNDMQTNMPAGNDKRATDEEQNITEEEQETRIEKHEEQQEESQNEELSTDQKQQKKLEKPVESPPPKEGSMVDESSSGIPKESKKEWKTQAGESDDEKERQAVDYKWELCNVTSGTDYVPCLDNVKAIEKLTSRKHFEHRERHCPEEGPMCLVPIPEGYMTPIPWPQSRDKIWFHNVPHKSLANIKGHQNWVKVTGEFLTFPGGGTQFIHGALHYIDLLQQAVPEIEWGKHTRVVLDVGCGVASFGGYLFDRNVLAMSLAPNDEHESQIQFALERGIPGISAVMGSQRLPFPSNAFDLIHCARCRVPWHREGGMLLLEINRLLRPGGYFVWSATPVYRKTAEDAKIWAEMSALTVAMCWELVTIEKDKLDETDVAIYRKPESNECFNGRKKQQPPMCKPDDDPNAAWYVPLQACMHNIPIGDTERGSRWPEEWPARVQTPPYWLNNSQKGIYGRPAPDDLKADYQHWKQVVNKLYMRDLGFNWTNVRNVMDMRAVYGGFAAALKDLNVWVLNVVNINSPDTLPIIYERGLFGIYHDWCESFSTYPRTYDLLHADHLFSMLKNRCKIAPVIVEVDRIVRPGGKLIVRDESSTIVEVEKLLKSLHWDVNLIQEGILTAQKSTWRPNTYAMAS